MRYGISCRTIPGLHAASSRKRLQTQIQISTRDVDGSMKRLRACVLHRYGPKSRAPIGRPRTRGRSTAESSKTPVATLALRAETTQRRAHVCPAKPRRRAWNCVVGLFLSGPRRRESSRCAPPTGGTLRMGQQLRRRHRCRQSFEQASLVPFLVSGRSSGP